MLRNRKHLAAISLCLTAPASLLYAQETQGSISGTITDSSGAAIQGATIVLTNTDRNHVERTLKTNGKGFYGAFAASRRVLGEGVAARLQDRARDLAGAACQRRAYRQQDARGGQRGRDRHGAGGPGAT